MQRISVIKDSSPKPNGRFYRLCENKSCSDGRAWNQSGKVKDVYYTCSVKWLNSCNNREATCELSSDAASASGWALKLWHDEGGSVQWSDEFMWNRKNVFYSAGSEKKGDTVTWKARNLQMFKLYIATSLKRGGGCVEVVKNEYLICCRCSFWTICLEKYLISDRTEKLTASLNAATTTTDCRP